MSDLSAYYNECFYYDEETGAVSWKERPDHHFKTLRGCRIFNAKFSGKGAGQRCSDNNGRRSSVQVVISDQAGNAKRRKVHRIIWEMKKGPIPPKTSIDHINGDPWDNRICNLRLATHSQNLRNIKIRSDNKSGVTGVSWSKGDNKWTVRISVDGRARSLGNFDEFDDAVLARKRAEAEYYEGFTRNPEHL